MLLDMLMSKKTLYQHSGSLDLKRNGIQDCDEVVSNALNSWVPEHAKTAEVITHMLLDILKCE